MTDKPAVPCITMFTWPQDDEGDYFDYRPMTEAQIEEVQEILRQAVDQGRIRGGWYVGPITMSTLSHEESIASLRATLDLDEDEEEEEQEP